MKQARIKPRPPTPPTRHWCKWLDWQIPLWVKIMDWLFWTIGRVIYKLEHPKW